MKNSLKYLTILCAALMFTSCLVDDEDPSTVNDQGPNLAQFRNPSTTLGAVSDGNEFIFPLKIEIYGPTIVDQKGDVQVTVGVDPSSTAIEGTHFKLADPTITLTEATNYRGFFPVTMLTDGINAPLDVSPVLVLNVTDATGTNVAPQGKQMVITLNYLCFSDIAGNYTYVTDYYRDGALVGQYTGTDFLTQTGEGEYRTGKVGHWDDIGGTPGMTLFDVCNQITIPNQNLVDLYSNEVEGVLGNSFRDADTGVLTFNYTIVVPPATADREYFVTYTPQ